MLIITYNGMIHVFNEYECDSIFPEERFLSRCWFYVKNMHNYKNNLDYLENLSYIWINIKYLNASYDDYIMNEISNCIPS
jgi:hypothetical protein